MPNPRELLDNDTKADLFRTHKGMAFRLASRFSTRYRKPHAEMMDEAESAMSLALADWMNPGGTGYNPTKVARSTWIYRRIYWSLMDYCTNRRVVRPFSSLPSASTDDGVVSLERALPAKVGYLDRLLRELGPDAQALANVVLFTPDGVTVQANAKTRTRRELRAYMARQGWTADRVERAWNELEAAL